MANIKVRDLTDTTSVNVSNEIMVLTNDTSNLVQNITIKNLLTNIISTDADNALVQDSSDKLFIENPANITGDLSDLTTTDKTSLVNAINEIDAEIGDLSDLTTTDKTSIVNAVNEVNNNYLVSGANKELSNLNPAGEARLHALKGYEDAGELLTDVEGLADVTNYAHSTFDSTKFTKVGTPNITDGGILEQATASNYVKTSTITFSNTNSIDIEMKIYMLQSHCYIFGGSNSTRFEPYNETINGYPAWSVLSFAEQFAMVVTETLPENQWITLKFHYRGADSYAEILENGSFRNLSTVILSNNSFSINDELNIGTFSGQPSYCNIDLKQCSITVDGVPVFSGNKTGIDTIKPDNYTVVGSPTISADGIASGFQNGTNYLRTPIKTTDLINKSWKIEASFRPADVVSPNALVLFKLSNPSSNAGVEGWSSCSFNANNNLLVFNYKTGDTNDSSSQLYKSINLASYKNEYVKATYEFDISTGIYTFNAYSENGTLIGTQTYTATSTNKQLYYINTESTFIVTIGTAYSGTASVGGAIDLNSFKIYVDSNLAYQPCLKIPYTESKTGAKVVDSYYRPRVEDMAGQFGYAPYYTLSDSDFTLPQGEIYGMMLNQSTPHIVESYENGKSGYIVYSNGLCKQWGYLATTSTSKLEYTATLFKTFKDTNYSFYRSTDWTAAASSYNDNFSSYYDNGYTAKTTSSVSFWMHENTYQNGTDWLAIGYIN